MHVNLVVLCVRLHVFVSQWRFIVMLLVLVFV